MKYLSLWFASEKTISIEYKEATNFISIRLRLIRNSNYYRNLNIGRLIPFIEYKLFLLQNFKNIFKG